MPQILSFGEILFDVFGTKKTLGGAPLNMTAHFVKLGGQGTIVSAVGPDILGSAAIGLIRTMHVDTSLIASSAKPTGRAEVTLVGKNGTYSFNNPCAWDEITLTSPLPLTYDALYFGTLAQRSEISRSTLKTLLLCAKEAGKEIFFDVNLRSPFYSREIIAEGLKASTILKMGLDEAHEVARVMGYDEDEKALVEKLFATTSLRIILITKGKDGSDLYEGQNKYHEDVEDVPVTDTVGAGDSFSAGFLYTYLLTHDFVRALKLGSHLASYVVSHRGAIPVYDEQLHSELKCLLAAKEEEA